MIYHNFVFIVGKQFLVATKTKDISSSGDNYDGTSGDYSNHAEYDKHGDYSAYGDYNNHIDYCKAFPCLDFCQDTVKKLGLSRQGCPALSQTTNSATTTTTTSTRTTMEKEGKESLDECLCGKPWPELNEISGGREAPKNEFPWIVRLVGGCASEYWRG